MGVQYGHQSLHQQQFFAGRAGCRRVRGLGKKSAITLDALWVTSEPRDSVLSILPQYAWHEVPTNFEDRIFGSTAWNKRRSLDSRSSQEIPISENSGGSIRLVGSHEEQLEPHGLGKFIADVVASESESREVTKAICLFKESPTFL